MLSGDQDDIIGLLHRPHPKRKTEEAMLGSVVFWAMFFTALSQTVAKGAVRQVISELREAIEAYELGKK